MLSALTGFNPGNDYDYEADEDPERKPYEFLHERHESEAKLRAVAYVYLKLAAVSVHLSHGREGHGGRGNAPE